MPFRNRNNRLRPIHTVKHIIDLQGATTSSTKTELKIAEAIDAPTLAVNTSMEIGSVINSIYLDVQAVGLSGGGVLSNIYMIVYKIPGANISASAIPDGNVTGISDFKRQIFHTEMRMLGSLDSDIPVSVFKGVLKIPKVFRTFRINDRISVQLFSPGTAVNFCLQSIYKEVR